MALLTNQDHQTLSSWNFLTDYRNNRADLLDIARSVFRTVKLIYNSTPLVVDCEDALTASLLGTSLFTDILKRKRHAGPHLYPAFASAMARYLLDNDWSDIIQS